MGHVLDQERSLGQPHNVIAVKEKIPLPPRELALLFQSKHRARHSSSQGHIDPNSGELRQNASREKVSQSKSSEINRKPQPGGRVCDDNELVKHMSNLPGFLLKVENENTIQEKALNFGVLDWKRLEKWKYTERMPGKLPKRTSTARGPPKMVPNLRKQPTSHSHNPSSSFSAKQPLPHGSRFTSPHRQPPPPHSSRLNSSTEERFGDCIKTKGKETCNQDQAAESFRIGEQDYHFLQRIERDEKCSLKKDTEKERISEREASTSTSSSSSSSSSKQENHKILISPNKFSAGDKTSEMRSDEVKLTSECSPAGPQNVLLREKSYSESSPFTECRTSLDAQLSAVAENTLSEFFSPRELYSGEISTDIPHSCPLPSSAVEPHDLLPSQAIDVESHRRAKSHTTISSKADCSMNQETARPSMIVETSNRKQVNISEPPTLKGRSPSPTRRFSFNLGKMSRSFSFKESSGAPQLSSTNITVNSGPVRPEVAPGMDNFNKDQANASSRSRSSPLRRLLDPFLKPKPTSETVLNTTGIKGPSQDTKPEASSCQALLQLTFKNGLPFFKLVVENSKDMLAAAVKRLPASGKSDPCLIYSFYSVHEIRKKSMNWINHGSKSKSYSLGYNIVGQMKISHASHPKGDTSACGARECVLYGVDPAQVDKQIPEFIHNREIAAIIVKSSGDDSQFVGIPSSNGTVVILPGGVHGVPIKGAPTSLISRWKSGGSCDCGGWDVGCKLRVLSYSDKSSSVLQESMLGSTDNVNFYIQGGKQKGKPVLSLKPFSNEFYSIELDASVSLMEAFATSVSYITCSKFPEMIDTEGRPEAERTPEANSGSGNRKNSHTFKEEIPAKYVTCPPLSPVGRI